MNSLSSSNPSDINIREILIFNHANEKIDVKNIVTSFTITESIYSPSMTLEMSLKDQVNLFEHNRYSGQERITINLSRGPIGAETEERKLEFYVSDYPVFGKSSTNEYVYTIRAVSPHGFLSNATTISKSFGKLGIGAEILKILNGIGVESIVTSDDIVSNSRGVLPFMKPLEACEFLRSISYDKNGAPVYLFQTFDGEVNLKSLSSLINAKPYDTFYDSTGYNYDQNTQEDFNQKRRRILGIASNLNLSKLKQIERGAYSSSLFAIDLALKTLRLNQFQYGEELNLNDGEIISPDYKPFSTLIKKNQAMIPDTLREKPLTSLFDSRLSFMPINSKAYSEGVSVGQDLVKISQVRSSITELMNNIVHDISLNGDFNLKAGSKIDLKIQKSIDMRLKDSVLPSDQEYWNEYLSGSYLVSSIIHSFELNSYKMNCRVKKNI